MVIDMVEKRVLVGSEPGLHARIAATIAEAASKFDSEIILELSGDSGAEPADAASSLLVLALGAQKGDTITVQSPDAAAVDMIAALIQSEA